MFVSGVSRHTSANGFASWCVVHHPPSEQRLIPSIRVSFPPIVLVLTAVSANVLPELSQLEVATVGSLASSPPSRSRGRRQPSNIRNVGPAIMDRYPLETWTSVSHSSMPPSHERSFKKLNLYVGTGCHSLGTQPIPFHTNQSRYQEV